MNDLAIRWQHSPLYEAGQPVYPDQPVISSPMLLRGMRNWQWEVEIRVHTLQHFMQGHGHYEVGDHSYPINPGDCFLFHPGQRVRGHARSEQPFTIFAAHFDHITPEGRSDEPLRAAIREITLMEALAEHAAKCRKFSDPASRREALATVHSIYFLFLGNLHRRPAPAVQVQVERLIEEIHRNLAGDWSIDRMREHVQLSRSQLSRWFNTLTGMSPTRFVIHQRIARAVELITMTRRSMQEIAAELGYRDVHFFTRQFTGLMGRPPGQLRRTAPRE